MNLNKPIPTRFETERLLVRRYELADEQRLFNAARSSIAEIFEFLPWCHPDYAIEDSRAWLKSILPNWREGTAYSFGIFDPDSKELLGGCGINQIDEHPIGNLGYWMATAHTRQGIASEASRALAKFGIEHLGLQRIEIIMSVENPGSKAVAESVGATYEGRLRNRLMLHGRPHDAYLYSITPGDIGK
ncbi:MAG: GNAT family N-acetyltransferase [Pseudomonadales bacterium]|nr:GNAT family N-acetyltransferase [Pseudomonadales bacterium]MBO6701492.1 GNAT family N-acetyltransferase [Pseudomonadales bacterium]MBO7007628.1 GNAT family N-acetyltransferase [Pseudomonadales bacterium]